MLEYHAGAMPLSFPATALASNSASPSHQAWAGPTLGFHSTLANEKGSRPAFHLHFTQIGGWQGVVTLHSGQVPVWK